MGGERTPRVEASDAFGAEARVDAVIDALGIRGEVSSAVIVEATRQVAAAFASLHDLEVEFPTPSGLGALPTRSPEVSR